MMVTEFQKSVITKAISKYRASQIGSLILMLQSYPELDENLRYGYSQYVGITEKQQEYVNYVLAKYPQLRYALRSNKAKHIIVDMMINAIKLEIDKDRLIDEYSDKYEEDLELENDSVYQELKKLKIINEIEDSEVNTLLGV